MPTMDATGTIHYNMLDDDYYEHQYAWMDGLSKKEIAAEEAEIEKGRAEEKANYEKEGEQEE